MEPHRRYSLAPGLLLTIDGEGGMVAHPESNLCFNVNRTGAFLIDHLRTRPGSTMDDLVRTLSLESPDVEASCIRLDALEFMKLLVHERLVLIESRP
jgi:hypothetical protein